MQVKPFASFSHKTFKVLRTVAPQLVFLIFFGMNAGAQQQAAGINFNWSQLKHVPDADGFAGSYAGISGNALLVAGGANFPHGGRPWTNAVKSWYDNIFALDQAGGSWKIVGKLPKPMGYGVSLTYKDNVICLGGGDATQNYNDVFLLKYLNGKIITESLPSMPVALINACGVVIGDELYVAGGITTPTAKETTNIFLKLDMSKPANKRSWETLVSFPCESRMLAMAGTEAGCFYLFGGVHLFVSKGDTMARRKYLNDCWKFTLSSGWSKIADMPFKSAAAPSPAYNAGQSGLVIFGGDDGANANKIQELKDIHPGFKTTILVYNTFTDKWATAGEVPVNIRADAALNPNASTYAPVTTPLVIWNNKVVIAGGEVRPAVRTNRVLTVSVK